MLIFPVDIGGKGNNGIPAKMLCSSPKNDGIFFGTVPVRCRQPGFFNFFRPSYEKFSVIKPASEDGHNGIFGGSESGKSAWSSSMI